MILPMEQQQLLRWKELSMSVSKFKRFLSVLLTLSMILSWNMPAYAAGEAGDGSCQGGNHQFTFTDEFLIETEQQPTCSKEGTGLYKCAECGYYDDLDRNCYGPIAKLDHDYKVVETAATCTEPKKQGLECNNCGHEDVKEIGDPLGHSFTEDSEIVEYTPGDCTHKAQLTRKCIRCDVKEKDDKPDSELTEGELAPDVHHWKTEKEQIAPATCSTGVKMGYKCQDCEIVNPDPSTWSYEGEPVGDHDFTGVTETKDVPATCLTPSYKTHVCNLCKKDIKVEGSEDPEGVLDPENHEFWTEEEEPEEGTHRVVVEEANCKYGDISAFPCRNPECEGVWDEASEEKDESTVDPTKHVYGTPVETAATCTEAKKSTKTCIYPHAEGTPGADTAVVVTTIGEPLGHDEEIIPAVPATHDTPGSTEGKRCKRCDTITVQPEVIPAGTGDVHDFTELVKTIREATCKVAGVGKYKCSSASCDKTGYKVIPAGHNFPEEGQGNVTKQPTCTEDGEETVTCARYNEDPDQNKCDLEEGRTSTRPIPATGHTWMKNDEKSQAPTCAEDGFDFMECSNCTETKKDIVEANGQHNFQDDVNIPATCQHPEQVGRACTVCFTPDPNADAPEDVEGSTPTDHEMIEDAENSKPATCTEDGVRATICKLCGEYKETEPIPAAHTFEMDEEGNVKLTPSKEDCTAADNKYVKTCTVCGDKIDATAEETAGLPKLPATKHNYDVAKTLRPSDCHGLNAEGTEGGTNGLGRYACQNPGCTDSKYDVIAPEHTPGDGGTVTKQPTCTEPGEKSTSCSVCDLEIVTEVPALNHDVEHAVFGLAPANCTEPARMGMVCPRCGEAVGDGEYVTFEDGMEIQDVLNAYEQVTGQEPDEATIADLEAKFATWKAQAPEGDHEWTWAEEDLVLEATCTTDGKALNATCSRCDAFEEEHVIPKTGHDEQEEVIDPTCTENGKVRTFCANGCTGEGAFEEKIVDLEDKEMQALGHDLQIAELFKEPTCTETGFARYECSRAEECGLAPEYKVIPAAHTNGEGVVKKPATCTEPGVIEYTCEICGTVTTEEIEALEHDFSEFKVIDATCTESGKIGQQCSKCGTCSDDTLTVTEDTTAAELEAAKDKIKESWEDKNDLDLNDALELAIHELSRTPLGHDWVKSTEADDNQAPTCTIDGFETYNCSRNCGVEADVRTLEATGHVLEDTYVAPNCTENAKVEHHCSKCNDEELTEEEKSEDLGDKGEEYQATGHTWDDGVEKAILAEGETLPEGMTEAEYICEHGGELVKTCTNANCPGTENEAGETVKPAVEKTPIAAGHKWVKETYRDENGKEIAIIRKCSRCELADTEDPIYMLEGYGFCPKEGHGIVVLTEEDIKPGTPATCVEPGTSDEKSCPKCREEGVANVIHPSKVIPATGKHVTTQAPKVVDPTCTEDGYTAKICDNCDQEFEKVTIEATGHNFQEKYIDATCTEYAKLTKVCVNKECGIKDPTWTDKIICPPEYPEGTLADHDFSKGDTCEVCKQERVKAVTTGSKVETGDSTKKVTFNANISVLDKQAEVVEKGILYITAANYEGDAKADLSVELNAEGGITPGDNVKIKRVTTAGNSAVLTINLGTSASSATRQLYARGYVIVRNGDETKLYLDSNILTGTYNTGFGPMADAQ